MAAVKTVLFDIGNVFVHWDPRFLYEKLIPDVDELDRFLKDVVTLEWHTEHDKGKSFKEGTSELAMRFPEYEDLIKAYDTRWTETISGQIDGTVHILERLVERGICVYALTNFSAEKWPPFCREYAFTDLFEGVVVSGEEKLVKPDPAIFQIAIDRYSLDAEATLYVDDRLENVEAAEAKKMQGHHFTDPAKLLADLEARGLL